VKDKPKISVVTRSCDRPDCLLRAAKHLDAQSNKNFEWVIVDDGDVKLDLAVIWPSGVMGGYDIRHIIPKAKLGRARAAILGLEAARGEYCLIHDDDDCLYPLALERLSSALDENSEAVAATCDHIVQKETMAKDGLRNIERPITVKRSYPPLLQEVAHRNSLLTISTLFRKSHYDKVGGIKPQLSALEDWDLWLNLLLLGDIIWVPEVLAIQYLRSRAQPSQLENSDRFEHWASNSVLRNYYLREDIKAGKYGLGHLMNMPYRQTIDDVNASNRILKFIKHSLIFWK